MKQNVEEINKMLQNPVVNKLLKLYKNAVYEKNILE